MKFPFASVRRLAVLLSVGFSFVASAEEAYLESNGTQCVPIDYRTKPTTKYVLEFQNLDAASLSKYIFGSWSDTGTRVGLWMNGNGSFEARYGGKYTGRIVARDTLRRTLTLDIPNHQAKIVAGSSVATKTLDATQDTSASGSLPVSLFAMLNSNNATDFSWASTIRFYDLKVYESEVLVHHYIPCVRDGLAGVYDTESGAFFTDSRTPLASGGDILQFNDDEDDAYVSSPSGKVSVETGYQATSDTCFDVDFQLFDNNNDPQQFVFETGYSGSPHICGRVYVNSLKGCSWSYANGGNFKNIGNGATPAFLALQPGARHRVILDSYNNNVTYFSCGITNACHTMDTTRTNVTYSLTTKLFSDTYSSPGHWARMKLYGFKIYEKGVLMHDYRPMKSFGVGVLKDQVTGRILSSKTSTALSFGGKIKELPYLESLGTTQCIALNYYPNAKTYLEMDYQVLEYTKANVMLASGVSTFSFRINNSPNQEFRCCGAYSGGGAGRPAATQRYTAVMDVPSSKVDVRSAGVSVNSSVPIDMTGKSGYGDQPTSTYKLGVFGDGSGSGTGTRMRVFFLSIWEDGKLIHKYEPYVKDGVPGLKDSETDEFASGKTSTGNVADIVCGGEMPYEGEAGDAYVESDGTQAVLTDYTPKANSRIEVDFKMLLCASDAYLCGSNATPYWDLYISSSVFKELAHSSWYPTNTIACDRNRHVGILDGKNRRLKITSGAVTNSYVAAAAASGTTVPFSLFARTEADGASFYGSCKARIYSVRIYENDTTLVREFLPYQNGTVIGFRDSVTGVIVTNAIAGASALKIGGIGVEGSGSAFKVAPADTRVDVDETGTLSAYAPGAVKYVWTRDGETVAGASGATLSVTWDRHNPHEHVYTVTPVYNVFGNEVKGSPVSATVENAKRGHVILLK